MLYGHRKLSGGEPRPCNELLKHVVGNSILIELPVRPGRSVRSKKRLTEPGTDLNTILRCFLSFKTFVTSQNIIVFKIIFPGPKMAVRVTHAFMGLVTIAGRANS